LKLLFDFKIRVLQNEKGCLSEEVFKVVSNEESHNKQKSFDGKARRISQDDKNTLFCRTNNSNLT